MLEITAIYPNNKVWGRAEEVNSYCDSPQTQNAYKIRLEDPKAMASLGQRSVGPSNLEIKCLRQQDDRRWQNR